MAIYHLHIKNIPKGNGQSKAIYNMREGKYAKDKEEILYKETGNLPTWAQENHRTFWKAADIYERGGEKYRGRSAKEIQIALPKELSDEAKIQLAKAYTHSVVGDHHAYAMAIHKGEKATANPHIHLLFTERRNDGINRKEEQYFKRANTKNPQRGGAKKDRGMNAREWVSQQRKAWESFANQALEREGHEARIDCRTLKEQGIEREPTRHVGVVSYNAITQREEITDRAMEIYGAMLDKQELEEAHIKLEAEYAEVKRELTSEQVVKGIVDLYMLNEEETLNQKPKIDWNNFDKSISREIEIAEEYAEIIRTEEQQQKQEHVRSHDDGLSL